MTLKEFFRKARRGRRWAIDADGKVRCASGLCPLQAAGGGWLPRFAARALGMRFGVALKIAHAADAVNSHNRPWLLKNLGVKEIAP